MKNPWTGISSTASGGYVLGCDSAYMAMHNHHATSSYDHFRSNYTPEPRLGPINAPVYILMANPSYKRPGNGMTPAQLERAIESLHNEYETHLGAEDPDNILWGSMLRELRDSMAERNCGHKLEDRICSVSYSPYRALTCDHAHIRFPSQTYGFNLIRNAMRERPETIFIVARSLKEWGGAIPELLLEHVAAPGSGSLANLLGITSVKLDSGKGECLRPRVIIAKNRRRPLLTRGNLGDDNFERVLDAVCASEGRSRWK